MINNLSLLIYTSEKHTPIAGLCAQEFNRNSEGISLPKYVTSNTFKCDTDFQSMGFLKLNSNIPYCNGGTHFSQVMIDALSEIETDYILFLLEDYILINQIKIENLVRIMDLIQNEKIDHLSLMAYDFDDWNTFDVDYVKYQIDKDILLNLNTSYRYMLSVQPCIWKRSSLLKVLNHNPNLTIHQFDTSYIKNTKGHLRNKIKNDYYDTPSDFWDFGLNHLCLRKTQLTGNFAFDEHDGKSDYFLFLYSEIIRNGKFNFNTHKNNKIFLDKFLNDQKISSNNNKFSTFF